MVGLADACEQWWKLGWRGPGGGPAGILGEGLVGWPSKGLAVWPDKGLAVWPGKGAVVPGKGLARGLVAFLGKDLAEDRRLLILI